MISDTRLLKVVWICSFSNPKVREHLPIKKNLFRRILYIVKGSYFREGSDMAVWNTNAIAEMEKMEGIELHVICPVRDLARYEVRYVENNIHYYFFREQDSRLSQFLIHQVFYKYSYKFKTNRKYIKSVVNEVIPDVVHVIGAENPFYSLSLLDVPETIPIILQLQTLLIRLVDVTKDASQRVDFKYKGRLETELINKATYIGTTVKEFQDYIFFFFFPDAKILNISLAMGNIIDLKEYPKEFDFVYFANDISKACLECIEAFLLAWKKRPAIKLNVIGSYSAEYRKKLDDKIAQYKATDNVIFEGRLPSHDDVIKQIKKSKFALIPLKMDFVPNTIREAMANGLPVVTTITDGTPSLNAKRESVLLSEQGDYQAMADNMLRLIDNTGLQKMLRENAAITESENLNNQKVIEDYCKAYRACVEYKESLTPIPEELISIR